MTLTLLISIHRTMNTCVIANMTLSTHNKQWILLYNDAGTAKLAVSETLHSLNATVDSNHYEIKLVNKEFVNYTAWEQKTALFIMPGGRSKPFYRDLAHQGNEKIIAFVNHGGNYLGICAGGYYGCRQTEFEINQSLETRADGILNFFAGTAWGPAYGVGQFSYENNNGAKAAQIIYKDNQWEENYTVYFNGGAYFIFPQNNCENTKILARYSDITHSPAAIIACQVGQGLAILTGVHPEYSYRAMENEEYADTSIYAALKKTETKRLALFKKLIQYLNIKCCP